MFKSSFATSLLETHRLFGLPLINATMKETLDHIFAGPRRRVAFVNADCVNIAAADAPYRRALASADVRLPDGSGLAMAARMQGVRFTANLNGTDLFPLLCQRAAEEGKSVYFLGGQDHVAATAAETATFIAPGLEVAGARHGYFTADETESVIREINESGADILLVGLGAPRQDVWLAENADRLKPTIQMGVGGLFDFYSGRIPRAPMALRRAGLEWSWRLMMEPTRLARRYLIGNPVFLARAASEAFAVRGDDALKRLIDVTVAAAGLLALSPLLLLVAAAIRLDSKGPAIFTQIRIGRNGAPFRMAKFRSMRSTAEEERAGLLAASDRAGLCFKSRTDPRVTRIGRFLRSTSIDELPQLFNVLRGDMSLVGPRPALPSEVAVFPAAALARHDVKPGLTGLWQVSGRAEIGFEKMIEMDLAYSKSRSLLLDLMVLALSPAAILARRGAF